MTHGPHRCGEGWWARLARKIGLAPARQPPIPEQDKAIARRALAQGDLPHTDAAIGALTQRSLQQGDTRPIVELFRLLKIPRGGHCCYSQVLVRSLLRLPALTEFERHQCEQARRQIENA